jgi:hypothetical protein
LPRLKVLEDENRKVKQVISDLSLDKDVIAKQTSGPHAAECWFGTGQDHDV